MADPAAPSPSALPRFRAGALLGSSAAVAGGGGPGSLWRHGVAWTLERPWRGPVLLGSLLLLAQPIPVAAQGAASFGQPLGVGSQDRQIFGNGSGSGSGMGPAGSSSGLDINNPIDLINRIRRSTALDDATPPASAVDQALKALEAQSGPAPSGPAAGGKPATAAPPSGGRPPVSAP